MYLIDRCYNLWRFYNCLALSIFPFHSYYLKCVWQFLQRCFQLHFEIVFHLTALWVKSCSRRNWVFLSIEFCLVFLEFFLTSNSNPKRKFSSIFVWVQLSTIFYNTILGDLNFMISLGSKTCQNKLRTFVKLYNIYFKAIVLRGCGDGPVDCEDLNWDAQPACKSLGMLAQTCNFSTGRLRRRIL